MATCHNIGIALQAEGEAASRVPGPNATRACDKSTFPGEKHLVETPE